MSTNMAILILRYDRLNRNVLKANLINQKSKKHSQLSDFTQQHSLKNNSFLLEIQQENKSHHEIEEKKNNIKRIARSILMFEGRNTSENINETLNPMTDVHLDYSSDSRASRAKRADGRGKQRRKVSKGRLKRSRRRLGTRGPLLLY